MRDKLFLTGELRVGKSTCVDAVLAALRCRCAGFRTYFAEPARERLLLSGLDRSSPGLAAALSPVGRQVFPAVFDAQGASLLSDAAGAPLIVMDELGRLERDALRFQSAVFAALDGPSPVLGVLRHDAHGWLDGVREHPRVRVLELTTENRQEMPALLLRELAKLGVA